MMGFLYRFNQTRQPQAGTLSEAFDMRFSLPALDMLGFSQYVVGDGRGSVFNPIQPPQAFYTMAIPNAGLGGVQAGQIYGQGLMQGTPAQNVGGTAAKNVSSGSGFINPLTGVGG